MTTLINTPQGVIAVVDRPPKLNDIPYIETETDEYGDIISEVYKTIIASTFGVGKELQIIVDGFIVSDPISKLLVSEFSNTKPYEYTETENLIVIKL